MGILLSLEDLGCFRCIFDLQQRHVIRHVARVLKTEIVSLLSHLS